jgi:hypothetical protein
MAYVNAVYDIAVAQSGLIYAIGEDKAPDNLFSGGDASRKAMEEINLSSVSVK